MYCTIESNVWIELCDDVNDINSMSKREYNTHDVVGCKV
jgi:hypothetical protein